MVDDKLRILPAMQKIWGNRPASNRHLSPADLTIERIADPVRCGPPALLGAAKRDGAPKG
jgi:hypothetical protein